jgi:hypothetical protein
MAELRPDWRFAVLPLRRALERLHASVPDEEKTAKREAGLLVEAIHAFIKEHYPPVHGFNMNDGVAPSDRVAAHATETLGSYRLELMSDMHLDGDTGPGVAKFGRVTCAFMLEVERITVKTLAIPSKLPKELKELKARIREDWNYDRTLIVGSALDDPIQKYVDWAKTAGNEHAQAHATQFARLAANFVAVLSVMEPPMHLFVPAPGYEWNPEWYVECAVPSDHKGPFIESVVFPGVMSSADVTVKAEVVRTPGGTAAAAGSGRWHGMS